ncbi:MAG: flagellar biosynthetic protein FliR [Opitutae bacterium]|nr:flagellar biosynthetic protein FliR [Opitutae bacterium]
MPVDLLFCWMMVFLRSMGVLIGLPALPNHPLPPLVRAAFGAMLATLLYPLVPHVNPAGYGWAEIFLAAVGEMFVGLLLGFVVRFAFAAVEMAGRIITGEIGITAAPGMGVPDPGREPVAAFLMMFAGVLFFSTGAHHGVLAAFTRSFDYAAAGHPAWNAHAADNLVTGTGRLIELGVRIAAPFIALNFLVTLAFSVLGRAVPRMNVFVTSYSVRGLVGLALLAGAGVLIARYLSVEFQDLPTRLLEMMPAR